MADYGRPGTPNAPRPNVEELLRPLVTCGICMELYVDPVALLNCLHLACGACAKDWLDRSTTCHQCREPVRGTRDSHHAASVVETYQAVAPNSSLCQGRTPEEIASLRQKYRPGERIAAEREPRRSPPLFTPPALPFGIIPPPLAPPSRGSSPGFDITRWPSPALQPMLDFVNLPQSRYPLNMSERARTYSSPDSPGGVQSLLEAFNDALQLHDNSCPFCDATNETGFVCPQPCTRQPNAVGRQTIPLGHTICGVCARFLPVREDLTNAKCVICTQTTCSEMGQRCRNPPSNRGVLQLSSLRDVEFPSRRRIPLKHAFGDNDYERNVFNSYTTRRGLNMQGLFREVLAFRGTSLPRATWHGRPFAPSSPTGVNLDDKVCLDCASDLVEGSLFEWWLAKRPEAGLPAEVTTRPDCQYGIECRTARHRPSHASSYNHICLRAADNREEDRDHDVPESGNRYVASSPELNHTFPAFSPSGIIFRDKGKEPVFLCSSVCGGRNRGAVIPGKVTLWNEYSATVYYGLDGAEHEHDGVVRILTDTRNMHWVRTSRGSIPAGCRPVEGGHITLDGANHQLYHCAVWWRGQRVPGYTSRQMRHAVITWGGSMWYFEDQYELLCWDRT